MTAVDERARAIERERAAADEDFFSVLMPEAARHVVVAGYGSAAMLQRKMRLPHATVIDLLVELQDADALGPPDGKQEWPALVDENGLDALLTQLATLADDEGGEDVAEVVATSPPATPATPVVSLVKTSNPPVAGGENQGGEGGDDEEWEDESPGGELVPRLFGRLATRHTNEFATLHGDEVPHLFARVRQAGAMGGGWLVDQPPVARGIAATRQGPKAVKRLVIWSPRGIRRSVVWLREWLTDAESLRLLAKHEAAGEGESYARVADARAKKNLAGRRWLAATVAGVAVLAVLAWHAPSAFAGMFATLVALGVVTAGRSSCRHPQELGYLALAAVALGWLAWWQGPNLATLVPRPPVWVWWLLIGGLVVLFGLLGRKEDQKLVEMPAAMASTAPPVVTAPMVIEALIALGNARMKDPDSIRVLMDPHRTGPFVQIDLELPAGTTAAWVVNNREPLAGAMRRPMSMVWPRVGNAHPDHLVVLVSEVPMNEMEQQPWPLLTATGPIDVFTPQPVFTNQLGDWVHLNLAYASWVIGAVPRMGKTFAVRELLLIYGMDPRVKVIALDGKGTGDLSPLAPFAHLHIRGARADKPENIEQVRDLVQRLLREMGRRADILADLPFDEVPESKVTSELINAHPELDLGPIVLGIDETQSFFSYGFKGSKEHKEIREEIRDGVIELMRMGPALAIWVIMATQTVRDSTIPTEAQAVAVYRYGMKMESHEPNDKVLGTGAHRAGTTATIFGFEEKGIGWFKGEGAKPFIARSVVGLDAVASRTLATRIRAWRASRGLLTGQAGSDGIEDAEVVYDLVADAAQVMTERGAAKAQWGELVAWLGECRGQYVGLSEEELSASIRSAGVKVRDVRSGTSVRKGVYLSDLRRHVVGDEE